MEKKERHPAFMKHQQIRKIRVTPNNKLEQHRKCVMECRKL